MYHWLKTGLRPAAARYSRWHAAARRVIRDSEGLTGLSDEELLARGREIRWKAKTGVPLNRLMIDAYAMVREAARRALGMQHFLVQIAGGVAMAEGHIVEMQTGEGKTLTATLPSLLQALTGHGCHIVTVNDYLAKRDAEEMGRVHRMLGLSTGVILESMETDERRANYACDITYGTAKEMGFDFLRDRLRIGARPDDGGSQRLFSQSVPGGERPVQRGHHFGLIDEADSILIDEARTPLIIGLTQPNEPSTVNLFRWSHRATFHLEGNSDFVYEPDRRSAWLTDAGCRKVLLMSKPSLLNAMDTERIYAQVEKALTARHAFQRDRDYVVVDDKVAIVDESTGRVMDGRKWQDGLHQAIEAKELVPITAATGQAARITVQAFFRQYTHLAGMTGTAVLARRELGRTYRLKVSRIPTHKKCIRKGRRTRVFRDQHSKRDAIVAVIKKEHTKGRPILIGTPSVEASEALSEILEQEGVRHRILNARYHEREAEIVAQAGRRGSVTIATNMAGRGTDIILGGNAEHAAWSELDKLYPSRMDVPRQQLVEVSGRIAEQQGMAAERSEVARAGGLHVIATEMHSSARTDRQLIGRTARQGDAGSFQFFLSLEDELLRCLEPAKVARRKRRANSDRRGEITKSWSRFFRRTQRFLQRTHYRQRKNLLRQEKFRSEAYEKMGIDPFLELTET